MRLLSAHRLEIQAAGKHIGHRFIVPVHEQAATFAAIQHLTTRLKLDPSCPEISTERLKSPGDVITVQLDDLVIPDNN